MNEDIEYLTVLDDCHDCMLRLNVLAEQDGLPPPIKITTWRISFFAVRAHASLLLMLTVKLRHSLCPKTVHQARILVALIL